MFGHHHGDGTAKVTLISLGVNVGLALVKWLAFFLTGSSSLFGEACHSLADCANSATLWIAGQTSRRPADPRHPSGYGREAFLWSLISSVALFVIGSLLTAYHGIHRLLGAETPSRSPLAMILMAATVIAELFSFTVAWAELDVHGGNPWRRIKESRDTVLIGVIIENGVDILTVSAAFAGFALYLLTGNPFWDGLFSLIIAALIAASSLFLFARSRSLLIGESASAAVTNKVKNALLLVPAVESVYDVTTEMRGPRLIDCKVILRLYPRWFAAEWRDTLKRIEQNPQMIAWLIPSIAREIEKIKNHLIRTVPEISSINIDIRG